MKMNINRDRFFYKSVFSIALPIALQNLITFATSMADTIMLGRADETGVLLSASSLANQPFFILSLVCFGMSGAATVLASQYWGKRDIQSIKTIFAIVLRMTLVLSALMGAAVLFFPEQVMRLYSNQPEIVAAGADYLRILGFAYFTFGISNTLVCSLRSVEIVNISVVINSVSFVVNCCINWILIFGHLGAPALGIRGAAIGTLTARILEFLIAFTYLFFIDKRLQFRWKDFLLRNRTLTKDLLRHGTPVAFNELMWAVGISVQAAVLGHIHYASGDPVAANSIAGMIQQLSTVFIFGLANAAAVLVGKKIGEGDLAEAKRRANTLELMAVAMGLIAFVIILLLRDVVVDFYAVPQETKLLARELLVVIAVTAIFVSMSSMYIVGILRGAGDTRFCLGCEMITMWLVAIPLALLFSGVWMLPVPIVLIGMKFDEPVKALVCMIRLRGSKWIKRLARDSTDICE